METNDGITVIESNKYLSKKADYCRIISILCNEFGYEKIEQALTYRQFYRDFKRKDPRLFLDAFNKLSYHWQIGKAREYLESLALEVQYSLICYLSESQMGDNHLLDVEIGWGEVA